MGVQDVTVDGGIDHITIVDVKNWGGYHCFRFLYIRLCG